MNKIKVSVINSVTGRSFQGMFTSQDEVDQWVDEQKTKGSWGKSQHDVVCDEKIAPNDRAIFKEDRSLTSTEERRDYSAVIDDEDGSILYYEKIQHVYTVPCEYEVTIEEHIDTNRNRNQRDKILSKTDWLFVADTPVPTVHRTYYKNYRQMLRDLDLAAISEIEDFEQWLMRTNSQEFMDGGEAEAIIKKFKYYL